MKLKLTFAGVAIAVPAANRSWQLVKIVSRLLFPAHIFIFFTLNFLSFNTVIGQFKPYTAIDSCTSLKNAIFTVAQLDSSKGISYAGGNIVPDFYSIDDMADSKHSCVQSSGCDYSNSSLVYDVYYPSPIVYTQYNSKPLPAVIMFHGGGFSDCSSKENDGINNYCKLFAQRGFVAFNIEYRRGRVKDGNKLSPEQMLSIYRAVQDGRGAIRSIIQRQLNNQTFFKIDTSKLFIGGTSAGGIIALHVTFCNQSEMDNGFPGMSALSVLGPINKNDYYGSLNINFSIKGVLNMWGGLIASGDSDPNIPLSIESTDKIPVIAFHGELDSTVPYYSSRQIFSKGARATVTECGFTYQIISNKSFDNEYGSQLIYNRLKSLNITSELYLDSDSGHGLTASANFGLSTSNTDTVREYIVARAATFFQAVLNNISGNIQKTTFRDCKNNRYSCTMTNNYCSDINAGSNFKVNAQSDSKLTANSQLKVYAFPNPSPAQFTLTIQTGNDEEVEIIVTNIYGREIYHVKGNAAQKYIFGQTFAGGIYFVRVTQGKNIQTIKIVKGN